MGRDGTRQNPRQEHATRPGTRHAECSAQLPASICTYFCLARQAPNRHLEAVRQAITSWLGTLAGAFCRCFRDFLAPTTGGHRGVAAGSKSCCCDNRDCSLFPLLMPASAPFAGTVISKV